jgi:hypothetical protein
MRCAGVVAIDDSLEEPIPRILECSRRCFAASSAASLIDTADEFFCVVLNLNLDFGANLERVSSSFSSRALMAWNWLIKKASRRHYGPYLCIDSLVIRRYQSRGI